MVSKEKRMSELQSEKCHSQNIVNLKSPQRDSKTCLILFLKNVLRLLAEICRLIELFNLLIESHIVHMY